MEALKGKKTYIVAALMLLVGIVNALTGEAGAIAGIIDNATVLLQALGFATIRAGIASTGKGS